MDLENLLNIDTLSDEEIALLTQAINDKMDEFSNMSAKDSLAEAERIATQLPPIINQAKELEVKSRMQSEHVATQLKKLQAQVQQEYGVETSQELREVYDTKSKEYLQLAATAHVLSEEMQNNIAQAEEQHRKVNEMLNKS